MKALKYLVSLFALCSALAQEYTAASVGTTPTTVVTGPLLVKSLTLTGGSSATRFVFYDAPNTTTNITVATYSRPVSYTTNFTQIYTNTYGIVITNTFSGRYTTTEAVTGGTRERPRLWTLTVPANVTRVIDVTDRLLNNNLVCVASTAATVEVEYEVR